MTKNLEVQTVDFEYVQEGLGHNKIVVVDVRPLDKRLEDGRIPGTCHVPSKWGSITISWIFLSLSYGGLAQLSNLGWMPNSVIKSFCATMKMSSWRQFQLYLHTNYLSCGLRWTRIIHKAWPKPLQIAFIKNLRVLLWDESAIEPFF